jgi:polyphosphate glucokinase
VETVFEVVGRLKAAIEPDYVVLGGGDVDKLGALPNGYRRGANENAFAGGFKLWDPGSKLSI